QTFFRNGELAAGKRIASQTACSNRIVIREIISLLRGAAEKFELVYTEPLPQIEQLEILLFPATGVEKTITGSRGSLRFEPSQDCGRSIILCFQGGGDEEDGHEDDRSEEHTSELQSR